MAYKKKFNYLFVILLIVLLAACSSKDLPLSEGDQAPPDKEQISEAKAVTSEALDYLTALQNQNYSKAYEMVSSIYKDAGITEEEFVTELQDSELELSNYDIEVMYVRERTASETSVTNQSEPYFSASIQFKSKGETREEVQPTFESDVRWISDKIWLRKENGEWKYFANEEQDGVTWKPEVYAAALSYMEAIKDQDANRVFNLMSNFYPEYGETPDSINVGLELQDGYMVEYKIFRVTDNLELSKGYSQEILDSLVRVDIRYTKEGVEGSGGLLSSKVRSWYFHLENDEWKLLGLSKSKMNQVSHVCYLENTCDQYGSNNNSRAENESDNHTSQTPEEPPTTPEAEPLSKRDFEFMGISIGMPLNEVLTGLNMPYENTGEDDINVYWFGDISIYQSIGSEDYTLAFINDDLVTVRGISKGDSFEKVKELYGTNYSEELLYHQNKLITYESSELKCSIQFTITSEEEVSKISYSYTN
ncbi:hypothetical protein [Pseudalkalibacillus sp. SCS-8]|uniref:hypothetical protein n=1 Tax=Pseudalkalibacillus nanhaiensis TaxID=3115291 RepID=UPI0032DBBA74